MDDIHRTISETFRRNKISRDTLAEDEYHVQYYSEELKEEPKNRASLGVFANFETYIVIAVVVIVVILSIIINDTDSQWFRSLSRPTGTPPDYLFGIVWTILYIGLALAGIVAVNYFHNSRTVLTAFIIVLLLTLLWVIVFSYFQSLLGGLIVLLLTILATIWLIMMVRPSNTDSLNPIVKYGPIVFFSLFLLWIVYATYLNAGYVAVN